MTHTNNQRGIALLITLLVMSVLLAVSGSLLNITLKQYQFASIGLSSEMAFQAANAGLECMLFQDFESYPGTGKFDIGQPAPTIDCMGDSDSSIMTSGTGNVSHTYQFDWGSPGVCSDITIYKFYDAGASQDMTSAMGRSSTCPAGVTCTVIRARGYNSSCPAGGSFAPRTIEREITQRY